VHSDMHMVCIPADRDANPVRQFGANTADLQEIVAWLKKCRVKTIALESTGVYWIPLFELLESGAIAPVPRISRKSGRFSSSERRQSLPQPLNDH
jgi:hypothetical protein